MTERRIGDAQSKNYRPTRIDTTKIRHEISRTTKRLWTQRVPKLWLTFFAIGRRMYELPVLWMECLWLMDDTFDTIGRFGYVSDYDPKRHYARVEFPDLGIVSAWLPVGIPNSKFNHDECHLDIGEHVYCLLHDNTGIILCSVYDAKNAPPIGELDVRSTTFNDGTIITYDRKEHVTDITDCNGNQIRLSKEGISITSCKDINITAQSNIESSAKNHMGLKASLIDLN